jgi:hypothetical protein
LLLVLIPGRAILAGSDDALQQAAVPEKTLPYESATIIHTLGDVPLTTKFKIPGSSGTLLESDRSIGPEFTLTRPTTITEIGSFIESCYPSIKGLPKECTRDAAVVVNIHLALNGSVDPSAIIASYTLSNDNDPSSISYESARVSLRLEAGTYYAIFSGTAANAVVLSWASDPVQYSCKSGRVGSIRKSSAAVSTDSQFFGVRILGTAH